MGKIKTKIYRSAVKMLPTMNKWPLHLKINRAMRTFEITNGYRFDIYDPKSFAEKICTYGVLFQDERIASMIDKYDAKKYISDKLQSKKYVIPVYGIWDNMIDLRNDWRSLPNEFFIKSTVCCSGKYMMPIKKDAIDQEKVFAEISKWFSPRGTRIDSYCWGYKDLLPRVIAEEYMHDLGKDDLQDYKFYCFDGEPLFLHTTTRDFDDFEYPRTFYDMNWKKMDVSLLDHPTAQHVDKPEHFEEMKTIAKILSDGLPFVRVDLYEGEFNPLVGELTICEPACPIKPLEFDRRLGEKLILPDQKLIGSAVWKK